MRRAERHKIRLGISSIIVAIILLPVIFGVLAYSIYNLRTQYVMYSNLLANQEYRALSHTESVSGIIKTTADTVILELINNGLSTSTVKYVMVKVNLTEGSNLLFIINLTNDKFNTAYPIKSINITGSVKQNQGLILPPGSRAVITIEFNSDVESASAGAVTIYGTYIQFKPPVESVVSTVSTTLVMFTVPSLTDLRTRSDVEVLDSNETLAIGSPEDPGTGMTLASPGSGLWCLYAAYNNANLTGTISYSVEAIGFSGGWSLTREGPPSYSILATTDYHYNIYGNNLEISNSTKTINIGNILSQYGYQAVRIIAYDFKGFIEKDNVNNTQNPASVVGIGLYGHYNPDTNRYDRESKLYLNGTADKVYVYVRNDTCGSSKYVSYSPYLILGDFDNNGYTELLFITEDGYFDYYGYDGYENYVNSNSYGPPDLDDYSSEPLTFVFKGYPIDSNKYVAVEVTIRYYFHDNVGGDEQALDVNHWILNLGLFDPENNSIIPYYKLRYQYLTKMEDTYPPSWDYSIDTVQILIPPTGKTYYLALQFRDPFNETTSGLLGSTRIGGDIMLGVEYLSIVLMQQPQS
ncbi:MAG: hypothetical protein F7B59_03955 [Desulfurococcales archaeon]|nr:hypothetical protein [Desulfurococcales archaeon]